MDAIRRHPRTASHGAHTLAWLASAVVVMAFLVALAGPAAAHGDIASSTPEAGGSVKMAPRRVSLVLAEAPAKGSTVTVTDGCGDEVSGPPQLKGETISVAVDGGRPGRWKVELRSISAVDGHAISDHISFRVGGERDCSGEVEPEPDDPEDPEDNPTTSSRPPIENDDGGSDFPVVPFVLGTVAVVGIAVALRGPRKKS